LQFAEWAFSFVALLQSERVISAFPPLGWRLQKIVVRDISSRNSLAVEGKEGGINCKISEDDYKLLSLKERTEHAV